MFVFTCCLSNKVDTLSSVCYVCGIRLDKSDMVDKLDQLDKSDRLYKLDKSGKSNRSEKLDKLDQLYTSSKLDKFDKLANLDIG